MIPIVKGIVPYLEKTAVTPPKGHNIQYNIQYKTFWFYSELGGGDGSQ